MFCGQCGSPLTGNSVCPKCEHSNSVQEPLIKNEKTRYSKSLKNQIIIGASISFSIIIIVITCLVLNSKNSSVYFSDDNNVNNPSLEKVDAENKKTTTKLGVTSIEHDNTYYLSVLTTESVVLALVKQDSNEQKDNCSQDIIEIENRIIANYQIDAVNLCEMDKDFALELEKVIKYIYNKYPTARGYLTHISLGNISSTNTIAFFQWFKQFTTSSEDNSKGYKSRIILNSSFYLNESKFSSSVEHSTLSGHFPDNATIYSPLAHEFAHYLSFIATNNFYNTEPKMIYNLDDGNTLTFMAVKDFGVGTHSKRMIEEAYENYKNKVNTTLTFDEFRATISGYAMSKDETGNYIYDETIAEAFHDVYLNGDKAADASKEIVIVLEKYLEM